MSSYEMQHAEITKSSSGRRTLELDPNTVSILRGRRARQAEDKLLLGAGYVDMDLVFASPEGGFIHPNAAARSFDRRARRAGLPRIRFHDLRHSHAVHLIAAGQHPKVVSERLGHASASFTLDRYGHLMPNLQAGAATAVASLVDGVSRT